MKTKMKRLLPSLREKKRYIVFETNNPNKIESALKDFLGVLGMSKVNPEVMKDKFKKNRGIIRINHAYKDEVITALSLVNVKVIGVSGILKKADEKYLR